MAMTPEGRVKAAIKRVLKEQQIWYYMPVQNGMGRVGIPDFVCCANGKFLGIEAKAPGKTDNLTANQQRVRDEIYASSGWYIVVDEEAYLKQMLSLILRRDIK